MKIYTRERLEAVGVLKKEETLSTEETTSEVNASSMRSMSLSVPSTAQIVSYDDLANTVFERIQQAEDGYDQRQLFRDFTSEGYLAPDIQVALIIIQRQKRVVYLGH